MTARDFDALRSLRALVANGVRFVVIGGIAGRAWGSTTLTNDLDICYARSKQNHRALATALNQLEATLRGAPSGLPFLLDERTIAMGDSFTFETVAGFLDCLGTPSGTAGYADLVKNATEIDLEDDLRVAICFPRRPHSDEAGCGPTERPDRSRDPHGRQGRARKNDRVI